jgi:hypothetical protein
MTEEEHNYDEFDVGETTPEFKTAEFERVAPDGTQSLRIFWTWNHNGKWSAPTLPAQVAFARVPALYKMYAIVQTGGTQGSNPESAVQSLMPELLPEIDKALFPPGSAEENQRLLESGEETAPAEAEETAAA